MERPSKPPRCPLFPHRNGHWAKKIRGKHHYFGKWDDLEGALARYERERVDLYAGRQPQNADAVNVARVVALFLESKRRRREADELSEKAYGDYVSACADVVEAFGKTRLVSDLGPQDFEKLRASLAERLGPVRLGNTVTRVRSLFTWAHSAGILPTAVRFGEFKKPSARVLRVHRAKQTGRMIEAADIRRALEAARQPLRAMILLGVNCGFGPADCATLPLTAVDLAGGWIDHPRPKTGIARRCPLWPETVDALREAIESRPAPKEEALAERVFLTRVGNSWYADQSAVAKEVRKLFRTLGIQGTPYSLRRAFQTIADGARDFVATRAIMGHVGARDIADNYRERIDDERLRAVADHVRKWVFGG